MNFKQTAIAGVLASIFTMPAFAELDTGTTEASMNIPIFAAITNLDDFTMTTDGVGGAANTSYEATEEFNLESNAQVRVTLTGGDLANGADSVTTSYSLDAGSTTLDTLADSVHNDSHTISATGTLGEISDQRAGDYAADLTLTVSAL